MFSVPETEIIEPSAQPTKSPTIRSKSTKMPTPVTIIKLPVPEDDNEKYDMSMSASFSIPLDPEFDGLDDTEEFSLSMPEQDFDVFSVPEVENEPSSVQPSTKPTKTPTAVTIITLPVPEEDFDEFDIDLSMSTSFSLPSEQEFEEFEPDESTEFSDDGFDVVGSGSWLDGESMPYGDRPVSLSMSMPVDPDYGFDSTGDGWWLDGESMPYGDRPMSLSMSMPVDPDYGFDGIGDWWWLHGGSMPYGDRPMSFSLSMSVPDLIVDATDDAPESFSNDVDEFKFTWAN